MQTTSKAPPGVRVVRVAPAPPMQIQQTKPKIAWGGFGWLIGILLAGALVLALWKEPNWRSWALNCEDLKEKKQKAQEQQQGAAAAAAAAAAEEKKKAATAAASSPAAAAAQPPKSVDEALEVLKQLRADSAVLKLKKEQCSVALAKLTQDLATCDASKKAALVLVADEKTKLATTLQDIKDAEKQDSLLTQIAACEKLADQALADLKKAQADVQSAISEQTQLKDDLTNQKALASKLSAVKKQLAEAKSKLATQSAAFDAANTKLQNALQAEKDITGSSSGLQTGLAKSAAEVVSVDTALNAAEGARQSLTNELSTLKKEGTSLVSSLWVPTTMSESSGQCVEPCGVDVVSGASSGVAAAKQSNDNLKQLAALLDAINKGDSQEKIEPGTGWTTGAKPVLQKAVKDFPSVASELNGIITTGDANASNWTAAKSAMQSRVKSIQAGSKKTVIGDGDMVVVRSSESDGAPFVFYRGVGPGVDFLFHATFETGFNFPSQQNFFPGLAAMDKIHKTPTVLAGIVINNQGGWQFTSLPFTTINVPSAITIAAANEGGVQVNVLDSSALKDPSGAVKNLSNGNYSGFQIVNNTNVSVPTVTTPNDLWEPSSVSQLRPAAPPPVTTLAIRRCNGMLYGMVALGRVPEDKLLDPDTWTQDEGGPGSNPVATWLTPMGVYYDTLFLTLGAFSNAYPQNWIQSHNNRTGLATVWSNVGVIESGCGPRSLIHVS